MSAKYRASADFRAEGDGELSVVSGELLLAPSATETNGWIFVKTLHEPLREGFVPSSYLEKLSEQRTNTTDVKRQPAKQVVKGGGVQADQYSTGHAQRFQETLEYWKERERRFLAGEEEKLPVAKKRVYFYWDKYGVRHGPLTEDQMRAKFDDRQIEVNTPVALATEEGEADLAQVPLAEYFPSVSDAFRTVPVVKDDGLWWCYKDDLRNVQGPYSAEQLYTWFQEGYFNADTLVRLADQSDAYFVPLSTLFPDGAGAFLTKGQQPQMPLPSTNGFTNNGHYNPVQQKKDLTLDFDPSFKIAPLAHTEEFFTQPLNSVYAPSATTNPYDSIAAPPPVPFSDVEQSTGWQVAPDPWAQPRTTAQPEDIAQAAQDFDPLLRRASSGKQLFQRALSGLNAPPPALDDIKIELTNPLENRAQELETDEDPFNLDWLNENTGKDVDMMVDVPEPIVDDTPEPPPRKEEKKKPTAKRKIAKLADLEKNYLSSVEKLYIFLTRPLPKDIGVVQCRIQRVTTGLHMRANVYKLSLEKEGKKLGPEILTARKRRWGIRSHYDIELGSIGGREAGKVISHLVHNHRGSKFVLHNDVPQHKGPSRDLCCVTYASNFEKEGGPRVMKVAIPGLKKGSETDLYNWKHQGNSPNDSAMVKAFLNLDLANLQALKNKKPTWNSRRRAWTLNFHGRVKHSSVKNFQLVAPSDLETVILQHGKVGFDTFTMDIQWPISPVVGFGVCLSSLHGKLTVE